jgi:hypothetical protein
VGGIKVSRAADVADDLEVSGEGGIEVGANGKEVSCGELRNLGGQRVNEILQMGDI